MRTIALRSIIKTFIVEGKSKLYKTLYKYRQRKMLLNTITICFLFFFIGISLFNFDYLYYYSMLNKLGCKVCIPWFWLSVKAEEGIYTSYKKRCRSIEYIYIDI